MTSAKSDVRFESAPADGLVDVIADPAPAPGMIPT